MSEADIWGPSPNHQRAWANGLAQLACQLCSFIRVLALLSARCCKEPCSLHHTLHCEPLYPTSNTGASSRMKCINIPRMPQPTSRTIHLLFCSHAPISSHPLSRDTEELFQKFLASIGPCKSLGAPGIARRTTRSSSEVRIRVPTFFCSLF